MKFSIEEDSEADTSMLVQEHTGPGRPGAAARYKVGEAILNRGLFLVVVGLVIIFCVCVAHNGKLGEMEWVDEHGGVTPASFYEMLDTEKQALRPLVTHTGGQGKYPLLVVIRNARTKFLHNLRPAMQAHGLNASALVLVDTNSSSSSSSVVNPLAAVGSSWRLGYKNLTETLGVMAVVERIVSDFGWGVLFLDADRVALSADNYTALDPLLGVYPGDFEAVLVMMPGQPPGFWLRPPMIPLVSASVFLLWPTENTAQLLGVVNKKPGAEAFALNAACNTVLAQNPDALKVALLDDVEGMDF